MSGREPIPAHYDYDRAHAILRGYGLTDEEIDKFWSGYGIALYFTMQLAADRHIQAFGKGTQEQRSEKQHENRRLG